MNERENVLTRFINKVKPGSNLPVVAEVILPANPDQKKDYKLVVYELETSSEGDLILAKSTCEALIKANFDLILDVEPKKETFKITVKSKSDDRAVRAEGALFLGLMEATRDLLETPNPDHLPASPATIDQLTTKLLTDLTSDEDLYTAFKEYYSSGLRMHSDQDKLSEALFESATKFNPALLPGRVSYYQLENVAAAIGMNLTDDETRDWYKKGSAQILKEYPQLSHTRLENPAFRNSAEG